MSHAKDNQPTAQARREDVVIQELQDEVLVYDLKSHKAHCLNQTAAFVWNHCDGSTTVAELAQAMEREWGKPVTEDFVWLALKQLSKSDLLEKRVTRPNGEVNLSRRAALRRGLVGTLALPLVISIVSPTVSAGSSIPAICQACIKKEVGLNNCGICADVCGQCYDNSGCGNGQQLGCQTCAACTQQHGVMSTYSWEAPNGCIAGGTPPPGGTGCIPG